MNGAATTITDHEFYEFQQFAKRIAGIHLAPAKKALVCGRLAKRLRHHQLQSYGEYMALLRDGREPAETQIALDLLTTNETHFFREGVHFDLLHEFARSSSRPGGNFRVWSAACSSGEEPYSIAMVLGDALGASGWEVLASDRSTQVLNRARRAQYDLARAKSIPPRFLRACCEKGIGAQEGTFRIDPRLQSRVHFRQINLNEQLPQVGSFDCIFLRNVMIYFELATKRQVVRRLLANLKPGGVFLVGHSESLNGVVEDLHCLRPSVYRKP